MPSWTHRIRLNTVDITSKTALGASVEEEENVSSLCDFVYYPDSGSQDPDALKLQLIQIDVDVGSGWESIFLGVVFRAIWDPKTRSYAIRGSNLLQDHFRAIGSDTGVLSALTGSVYSEAVFGEPPEDLWQYAQLCMETIETDVHLNRSGALALVAWAAKGIADHALDGSDIHNQGEFALEQTNTGDLVNQVVFEYQYRVQRKKIRTHTIGWSAWRNNTAIDSWCDWLIGPLSGLQFGVPPKSMVEGPLTGGSWHVPGPLTLSTHPESLGPTLCGNPGFWVNPNPEQFDFQVFTASAIGYRAFTQSIWETYTLTVDADASQTYYGLTLSEAKQAARDIPQDPEWPPENALPESGWTIDVIGDSIEDTEDETARANDLAACYQWASRRIRGAHRGNTIVVRADLRPDIGLEDTVSIDSFGLVAKGKVRRLRYVLNAAPYTELSLAISRGNSGSTDTWATPARPDSAPTHAAPDASQALNTFVGNWASAPAAPVPDERLGLVTNVVGAGQDGTNPYEVAFRVEWPEVEVEAVDEVEPSAPSTWEVSVPHDTLTVT